MTLEHHKLILASQSPRRRELLNQITTHFEVRPNSGKENVDPRRSPKTNALAIAKAKAIWVANENPHCFVIGADTLVAFGNTIIGKPKDPDNARNILKSLSGKVHEVITGVAVMDPKGKCRKKICSSKVMFHQLSDYKIDQYVETGEPLDKAGAYAIQGQGRLFIKSYQGSYSNIVGLPLETLKELLISSGFPF